MLNELPNVNHESVLSGILSQPNSVNVLNDAGDEIHKRLVAHGWPSNLMPHGLLYQVLWDVYCAGEQRGIARCSAPASALFPISD